MCADCTCIVGQVVSFLKFTSKCFVSFLAHSSTCCCSAKVLLLLCCEVLASSFSHKTCMQTKWKDIVFCSDSKLNEKLLDFIYYCFAFFSLCVFCVVLGCIWIELHMFAKLQHPKQAAGYEMYMLYEVYTHSTHTQYRTEYVHMFKVKMFFLFHFNFFFVFRSFVRFHLFTCKFFCFG